jgi:signal peptidase I
VLEVISVSTDLDKENNAETRIRLPGEDIGSKPNAGNAACESAETPCSKSEDAGCNPASNADSAVADNAAAESAGNAESSGSAGAKPAGNAESSGSADGKKEKGWIRETIELILTTLVLLIVIRGVLAEARYIPSSSMEPTLQVNDRLLVEKISGWMMRPIERGDILVFYPPPIELGGTDINYSPPYVMGKLTGLPCFPIDTAYIKRVVGLPGEQVRVERGVGVFINDQFLPEPYIKERPNYDLRVLGDIGGRNAVGQFIKPYGDSSEPILVPPGKLLMMGDNRNNSEDGHVFGFVDQKRVIGKSCLIFWRLLPGEPYKRTVTRTE